MWPIIIDRECCDCGAKDTTIKELVEALENINSIRNDIIITQTLSWSAHVYPLVAILDKIMPSLAKHKKETPS